MDCEKPHDVILVIVIIYAEFKVLFARACKVSSYLFEGNMSLLSYQPVSIRMIILITYCYTAPAGADLPILHWKVWETPISYSGTAMTFS